MSKLICALLMISSISAKADSIYLGMWSNHFNWQDTCNTEESCIKGPNETHSLLMVEVGDYEVGTFVNSYGKRSYIALNRVEFGESESHIRLDGHIGMVSGYDDHKFICFMTLAYTKYRVEPVVLVSPTLVAASFRIKF